LLALAALANIFHGLGDLTASPSPRDRSIVLPTHYLSAWAGLLLPELCHNVSLETPSMPLLFMFRNRPEQAHQRQLDKARRRLSFVPSAGQPGLDHACCSRDFRPYVEESRGGRIYRLPHSSAPSVSFRKEWLWCIRPSVLLFRKGGSLFMEPYFPHRFARNFGRDPSQEFFIPEQRRDGRVDILYARWWTRHSRAFREHADVVKAAEGSYLSRTGASISSIASKFIQREFPELVGRVSTVGRRRARAQVTDPTERKARAEALEPLSRPEGGSATSRGSGEPPLVYFWWRHFLLDCGYQVNTALSAFIPHDVSGAWERHLCHSIARVGLREFISWIENGTTLQHFWDAIVEAGKVVKVPFDRVVLPPPFSQAPTESFIPPAAMPKPDTSRSRKRRASREAGSSQSGTREGVPEPSVSVGGALQTPGSEEVAGATPREDLTPPAEDNYNPTFDGTPSPDMTGLPQASPSEPGHAPGEASAGGDTSHRAVLTPSLQEIHSLLASGSGGELPGFSDFAPGLFEGGTLPRALHCASKYLLHVSWIESGTTLQHFWDAIAEAGKAVKVPFDQVVLRPTFCVAPDESFIPEKDLPKRDAPSARKRRASEEAGPSQPAARGRTPEPPSPAVAGASTSGVGELAEGTPREDVTPQGDEGYNPTSDGTPSPEGADIPPVACTETGYIPVEAAAAEGVEHLAGVVPVGDTASSLQAIHDLLLSGSEAELLGFSDFAPGILEGGGWMQPLHSAMAVTSAAVLPTASPPEEGEVARGIAGDADGGYFFHNSEPSLSISLARRMTGRERGRVPLCLLLDPFSLADGAEIAAEMMESSALGAVLPPAVGTLHPPEGGDSASLPLGAQAVGGGLLPPSSSEAALERPPSFPGHGISWPDATQRSRVHGSEGMLDFYISSARAVMEESSPPSVDVVRDFLERSTVSYHLMGCPRDPWMAAVDTLWSEVRQRHQEAARHRALELAAEVALAEQSCHAELATLRRTLEEVSSRIAEHEATSLVLAEGVAAANEEVAAVERECAESQAALFVLQSSLADLRGEGAL
ncbi:hypothetical protein Taro_024879, partial [Colocasia esculenta]|nr:hypothetical protein [Colocasia esculenta]